MERDLAMRQFGARGTHQYQRPVHAAAFARQSMLLKLQQRIERGQTARQQLGDPCQGQPQSFERQYLMEAGDLLGAIGAPARCRAQRRDEAEPLVQAQRFGADAQTAGGFYRAEIGIGHGRILIIDVGICGAGPWGRVKGVLGCMRQTVQFSLYTSMYVAFLENNMRFVAVMMLMVFFTAAHGETASAPSFATRILAAHNAEREALKLPDLIWSDTLAAHAAVWANEMAKTGAYRHSAKTTRPGEGENLWVGTAGAYSPEEMVGAWAAERQFFQNGNFPNVAAPGQSLVPGHYTQIVWRTTTAVGCAVATGNGRDILVCRYSPAGNLTGEKVY